MDSENRYAGRGVSASKTEVHKAIAKLDKGLYPNAFCKILPDLVGGDMEFCNIMHADTAGTKTSLAYLYWKETGDISVWRGIAQDAMVMNLDDMACVGAVDRIVISSTIGRNKHLIPGEVLSEIIDGGSEFLDMLRRHDVDIKLAGGETADVGDIVRTIDVGYTTFSRMRRKNVLVNDITPGQVIVGLASAGKAVYEQDYNSGIGSNGLTSARHDLLNRYYAENYPESYDPNTPSDLIFTGSKRLTDKVHIDGFDNLNVGKLILSPTRTYLPVLERVFKRVDNSKIGGIIHVSGGAHTKVMKFAQNVRIVKDRMPPPPPVFKLIQSESGTSLKEMYQVFNMGIRLEIYCDESIAEEIIQISQHFDINAMQIGHIESAEGTYVDISTGSNKISY
jgi:phosphoribosylformylglycinamidine cyclo-ligase